MTEPPDDLRSFELRCLDDKVDFLQTLYKQNRKEEALTLCCVYIEGLAHNIYGAPKNAKSKEYFVKVLLEHGGEESLRLVDPPKLAEALRGCGEPLVTLARAIEGHFSGSPVELFTIDELVAAAHSKLSPDQCELLAKNAWLGTTAALAYKHLRCRLVHQLDSLDGLISSNTVFRGEPAERISFNTLYAALRRVMDRWKDLFRDSFPRADDSAGGWHALAERGHVTTDMATQATPCHPAGETPVPPRPVRRLSRQEVTTPAGGERP